jgi:hypothetical protein
MALGLTDHVWTIGELMEACLADRERNPRKPVPTTRFRVIEGGGTSLLALMNSQQMEDTEGRRLLRPQ